ncbi:ATP-dependent zinc metalloprotease FTSH 4 mitochondrial-like, partial [Trifolium medium]|nr:ATP-dependent zinc metalloprotease FTSH 4 mitochondrial-like [Trifolium medium]
ISNSERKEGSSIGGLAALKNVGEPTEDGIIGSSCAPIDMVDALEGGDFEEQLWRTIGFIAVTFLLICSTAGALIVHKGISKGITVSS